MTVIFLASRNCFAIRWVLDPIGKSSAKQSQDLEKIVKNLKARLHRVFAFATPIDTNDECKRFSTVKYTEKRKRIR